MGRIKPFFGSRTELINALLIILFITAFQGYWLYTVYTNQKNIIIKETENILREQVLNYDMVNIVSQIKTADTTAAASQVAELIKELSQNENVQISVTTATALPGDSTTLSHSPQEINKIVQHMAEGKKAVVKTDSLLPEMIKSRLKENFKHLEFKIQTNSSTEKMSCSSTAKVFSQADAQQFYQIAFLNLNTTVIREILPSILLSFLYTAICIYVMILLIKNIHKRKRLIQMKDNFTSSMTHEFKTPLSTLYTATEALGKYGVLDDKQMAQEYIELMQGELKRLNLMTESILNNAKLEAGKLEIKPENTQVYKLVDDALKKLNLRLQNAEAVVHTNSIAKDLYANLDQEHFTNVICNLIDNSLKYSNEPAAITIDAHKKDDMLEITYSDNGIGIPYKYRDDVFKPYFRIMENNIYTAQGHGLGLSYIKEVITLHKGSIKLIKPDNDKGTAFQILLPITNE